MTRRHESHVHWKHLAIYGSVVALVVVVGAVAIWSFIEKQSLVIAPEPLPKVTIVTRDAGSPLAASWVRLLSRAEMSPTLVTIEEFNPIEGVVVFCDIQFIPPQLAGALDKFVHRGGALAFVGFPPATPIGKLQLNADTGLSDGVMKFSEAVSPLLARLSPGWELATRQGEVTFLRESPRMVVDARWKHSSRAVVMHMEDRGARYLWFGFHPDSLSDEGQMLLLLRTAFRWVAGQPVSDGAIGPPQLAKTLTPDARRDARENRFAFSVDRMNNNPDILSVRMMNRGQVPLSNPTVKIWLPPRVTKVALAGDIIMKRNATLTGVPEDGACLVSLPSLTRNEDRVLKLRIVAQRPLGDKNAVQNASHAGLQSE